jgi:CRISPR-associated protein Csm4
MLQRYRIRPLSPLVTPLMSDTLFGHFCWALVYSRGEEFLTDFLSSYDTDNPAPVLFSAAFPEGTLPKPSLAPLGKERLKKIVEDRFGEDKRHSFRGYARVKKLLKFSYLSLENWQQLKNSYSTENLIETLLDSAQDGEPPAVIEESAISNTIDRKTGSVPDEGGLFQRDKLWYERNQRLDLYVETNGPETADLANWFLTGFLPEYGYGADKSIGMGQLHIELDESFVPDAVVVNKDPNARLSLCLAAFEGIEQYAASYRLKTKFGRLGGNFAFSSPTGGTPRPFKKPILMFEPGAVFLTPEDLNTKTLLSNVHTDTRIRHCGIPITLPFKISEVAADEFTST